MKEQMISFELAKLAKDKGFDVESLYFYTKPNSKMYAIDEVSRAYEIKNTARKLYECGKHAALNRESVLLAPTQSLLQKWLREEHNIHIVIDVAYNGKGILEGYTHAVYGNAAKKMDVLLAYIQEPWFVDTYEEALETGLEQALKLIGNGDKNKV